MPVPTATAEASLYRTSGVYRLAPGRLRSGPNVALAGSCYNECIGECPYEWENYECKQYCQVKCDVEEGPPPCLGELCIHYGSNAMRRCCPSGTTCCLGYEEYPSTRQMIGCCAPGRDCCDGKCCDPGYSCCYTRWGRGHCCPPGQKCCDGVCYTPGPGTTCEGGTLCMEGHVPCGADCCKSPEKCIDGKCCKPGVFCGGEQCCEGELCMPNGRCCPQDQYAETLGCCPEGRLACKVQLYHPSSGPEDDPAPYYQWQCCEPGYICVNEACCKLRDCCRNSSDCPSGKHCDDGKCCPQGQRAAVNHQTGELYCA
ncbi:hypothetical protein SAMN05216482_9185 [Streptomyces sp. PAN_FS17]|nr:hypothetical protein SAMN05216482_9185 [Streptomyces sp. PAN_FS17]